MENKTKLGNHEVDEALKQLAGWRRDGILLRKDFVFESFRDINAFLPYFGATIARLNHHPDFAFTGSEKRLSVWVTTHSCGCITQADLDLATALNNWRQG